MPEFQTLYTKKSIKIVAIVRLYEVRASVLNFKLKIVDKSIKIICYGLHRLKFHTIALLTTYYRLLVFCPNSPFILLITVTSFQLITTQPVTRGWSLDRVHNSVAFLHFVTL